MTLDLDSHLSSIFSDAIKTKISLHTGLNTAYKIELENKKVFFVKFQNNANDFLIKEAKELQTLAKFIHCPQVIHSDKHCLVLEYLSPETSPLSQSELAKQLAKLHQQKSQYFGFSFDNKLGTSFQANAFNEKITHWKDFFWDYRLFPQIKMAKNNGYLNQDIHKKLLSLQKKLETLLPQKVTPVLLHGDLWSGNFLTSKGKFFFIDPACYYGHNEIELALGFMFGGFQQDFYTTYFQYHPQEEGFNERKYLYQLYHYLNHLNIFGGSYLSSIKEILAIL